MIYINVKNNSECDHTYLNLKTNGQNIVYIKGPVTLQLTDP